MSRRFQFSLRALLGLTALVAAFFGGSQFGAKREQQRLASERGELEAARKQLSGNVRMINVAWKRLNTQRELIEERERWLTKNGK